MSGPVAWGAAWFEFGGDGVSGLVVRRVVVEFEKVSGLTVDAFVIVGFENDSFLTRGWMTPTV